MGPGFSLPVVVATGLTSLLPIMASSHERSAVTLFAGPNWSPAVAPTPLTGERYITRTLLPSAASTHRSAGPDFVVGQVYTAAAVHRVAVRRVPLAVYGGVRHAGVIAGEGDAPVVGAPDAKVRERQVVKVEMTRRVHCEFGVAATRARGCLTFERRTSGDPFEGLAAIARMPDPARVGRKRAGRAGVDEVRVRGVEPDVLLKANPADAADDRMTEGRYFSPPCFAAGGGGEKTNESHHPFNKKKKEKKG